MFEENLLEVTAHKPPLTRGVGGICSYDYSSSKSSEQVESAFLATDFTAKGQKQIPPQSPLVKGGGQ